MNWSKWVLFSTVLLECICLCIRSEIQKKELDLARVKDANYDLTDETVQLTTKLTEAERKSRERKEEIQKLKKQYVKT